MKILNFIGSFLYSILMYYIVWLFFYWITPYVMFMGWALFIVYLLFAGGALSLFVASLSTLLAKPLVTLCIKCKYSKYAPIIWALFFGYSSVKLPWGFKMDYSVLQWILGISLTIIILITFIALLVVPFKIFDE